MKKLILIAIFVVTWKTYEAKPVRYNFMYTDGTSSNNCEIIEVDQRKEFTTESEARKEAEEIGKSKLNYDVEIWKMEKAK